MTGNNTLSRNEVRFGGVLIGLLILTAWAAAPLAAADITVKDSFGGETFVASQPAKISWSTQPVGYGWSASTKLALYVSRGASSVPIAVPGAVFNVTSISGGNTINVTSNPIGTVNVNDSIILSGCIVNVGVNNGAYVVSSVNATSITVTAPLQSETVSATAVVNPGTSRVSGGITTIRTTTPHGLVANTSFVNIANVTDTTFNENGVLVTSTPTATSFTYKSNVQFSAATSGNGSVGLVPGTVLDSGVESQFIQYTDNTGALDRSFPNLIGDDVYLFLVDLGDTSKRIRSDLLKVKGVQVTSPSPGDIVTALLTPSPVEIRFELAGYPAAAAGTTFQFSISRNGLFSGGAQDEIMADLLNGADAQFTAVAPTIRGATAAYIYRSGAMTWTGPLTPEARVRVKTYGNALISLPATDETGITSGPSNDALSGAYIDRAFRIGAGSGAVPMFSPNSGEVVARVDVANGFQSLHSERVRYIPLASTALPVTTIDTGMLLEFSGDSGNTWEPLNRFAYTAASFVGPSTINLAAGSITAGVKVGAPIAVSGTANNNGTFTVAAVAGTVVTVKEVTVVAEVAAGTVFIGQVFDPSSSRFDWVTTQDPSGHCRLRTRLVVTAPPGDIGADLGAITNDIVDTTNADFTLRGVVWKGISSSTMMSVGSTQNLKWVSAGSAGRVNIRLSRNGGLTWETVANNTEDDGSYDWLVTGPVTANSILYIEQADAPSPYFDRTATFTIQGYSIVTPNGGEVFQIGSLQSILWISAGMPAVGDPGNAVNISLAYTDPSTGTPTSVTIASGVPNNLNYNWTLATTIPGVTDARITVANAATPLLGPGTSDNPFTILRNISLTTPNGGNTYVVGEVTPVSWTSSGLPVLGGATSSYIRAEYMVGAQIDSTANSGLSRASNLVTVKTVAAHGYTTGNVILITDASDSTFNGTFGITVTGANTFTFAQTGVNTASGSGVAYKAKRVLGGAKIDSVGNSGLVRAANVVTAKTTTNHGFQVGDVVRIVDCADASFVGNFTITLVPTANTFTYAQVGAGSISGGGATYRSTITAGTLNSGLLNNVWTSDDVAALARVRVLEVNAANVPQPTATAFTNDFSDSSFSVQTFVSEPEAISVTAPNGGENYILGQSVPITWTSSGQVTRSNTVTIRLTRDTTDNLGENVILATNIANTGVFSWLVTGAPTRSARIVVTSDADSNVTDVSDADFVIKGIQVLTPNSLPDSVSVGSPLSITWNFGYVGGSDNVKIEISRDGGTTFATIASSTPNNGGYLWVSQQTVSASCKVRVTSLSDASLTDTSDATFQLRGLTLTSPVGGEIWNQGTQQNVTWNSVTAGSFVDIDLSLDGGASYQRIANNAANNGSLVWNVAQPYAGNRILRATNFTAGTNTITFVNGSNLSNVVAGDKITVTGTVSNNGLLTVASAPTATTVTVTNTLVTEAIAVDVTVALSNTAQTTAFSTSRVIKTASFTAGTNTITFTAGANLTGVRAGDRVKISGTASNNGTYVIATIPTATTVTVSTALANENIAVDASLSLQPTTTRIYRVVSIDGTASSIAFGAGAIMSGLAAGQTITIAAPSINAGSYTIASVGAQNVVVTGVLASEVLAVDATVTAAGLDTFYISQPSAKALLRVTDTATSANRDVSDTVFSIPPVTPTALQFAAAPNAQPPFQFGTATTLQWNGQGMGATATLEFSSDSGVTYSLVDAAVPNSTTAALSTYVWTAPNVATANAVLRLTSNVAPNPSVSTTGVFTVNAPTVPSILLTPTPPGTITFTAVEDGASPADKTGTIQNIGSASTLYTLTVPGAATWLTIAVKPASGTAIFGSTASNTLISGAADNILFRASATGLAPATYTATVALTASGGALGVVPYTVNFTVTPAGIGLITATPVVASVPEGSTTSTVVTIQNRTAGNLTPVVSGLPSYASITALTPTIVPTGSNASTTLTLSAVGLTPGYYTATVTVADSSGSPSRTFQVQFTVTKAAISFENKKKSCAIGGVTDASGAAAFGLPFILMLAGWLLTRPGVRRRFFRPLTRQGSLLLVVLALVLLGGNRTAQAANIGSAEEGPSLFGMDVRVPTMLHMLDVVDTYGVAAINENVPLQEANFGGLMVSSGWVNQDPRTFIPKNMLFELQLGFMSGVGIANIQALTGAAKTKYDARLLNGRMLFALPLHLDRDEGVRLDDRHPIACNVLATVGYHYIMVDFDKTTVNELGRGVEVAAGASFDYGVMPGLVSTFSVMAVGRVQSYNNAFKDSKFNASGEGQLSAGLSWQFASEWQAQLQATGTATELIDFFRFGAMFTLRYAP